MDAKDIRNLMEAYVEVYAPQEFDEATAMAKRGYDEAPIRQRIARSTGGGEAADRATALADRQDFSGGGSARDTLARRQRGDFRNTTSSSPGLRLSQHKSDDPSVKAKQAARGAQRGVLTPTEKKRLNREEVDIFDVVLEFLQAEGFAETLEEAEWMMANMIDEEAIGIILGEAIYSEKGKAKAAEMIAKRSTPSGRAKSGKGANVAQIRQIRGSGRGDFDREGLGGTPMTPTMAKNPIKKQNYVGTGNKAARRAGLTPTREKPNAWKEEFEFWVDALVEEGYDLSDYTWDEMYEFYLGEGHGSRTSFKKQSKDERWRVKTFGSNYTPHKNYDPEANRGQGQILRPNQAEKQRRKKLAKSAMGEEYMDEAQVANRDPEKYEREQSKKYAPVRGERTPMPPRGDKRREDFEKWYAKQMGR